MLALRKKTTYCLVIIPFTANIDINQVKQYSGAEYVSYASRRENKKIIVSKPGVVVPFINEDLPVLIDDQIKIFSKIFFNTGRLDHSICIYMHEYLILVQKHNIPYEYEKLT